MPISLRDWEDLQLILQPTPPPEPPQAGIGQQLARGAASGLTFGMYRPFADAGEGGLPETIGNIAGSGAAFFPLARGIGAGVAGLAALDRGRRGATALQSALLRPNVTPPQAVGNLLTRVGRQLPRTLAPGAQIGTMAAAGGLQAVLPDILGTEQRSDTEKFFNTALGIGLGGLAGKLGSKAPAAVAGKSPLEIRATATNATSELFGSSDRLQNLLRRRSDAAKELDGVRGELISVTDEREMARLKKRARLLKDTIAAFDQDIAKLSPAGVATGIAPPPAGMLSPSVKPDVPAELIEPPAFMSQVQPRVHVPEINPNVVDPLVEPPHRLQDTLAPGQASQAPFSGIVQSVEAPAMDTRVARKTPFRVPVITHDITNLSGAHEAGLADPIAVKNRLNTALGIDVGGGAGDGVRLMTGVDALRRGKSWILPHDVNIMARILDDVPFGDYTLGCFYGSPCRADDAMHLLKPGWSPRGAVSWLGRKLATPRWFLAGTAAEKIPQVLAEAEGRMMQFREKLYEASAPFLGWSDDTKRSLQRVFYQHMRSTPDQFANAVRQEVPEATDALPVLQDILANIRADYMQWGVLRPFQKWNNYFPVVRERLMVTERGIMEIERGDGYMPIPVQNLISPRNPVFAKTRSLTGPDDFPRNISFDDTLRLYFTQYARYRAVREIQPELNEILRQTPDDTKQYVADLVNFWMGEPQSAKRMSDMGRYLRQFQFTRTIGASILSPLVNTLQRVNTWSLVSTPAFLRAFTDMKDPERLKLMGRAGLTSLLGKFDVPEDVVGGGAISNFAQKLSDVSGKFFEISERNNKIHAFMAGLREAERRGLEGDKATQFAKNVMWDTQFIQTRANVPEAFRGEFGRFVGQFQTYRLNQVHFMTRLIDEAWDGAKRGDIKSMLPLVKYLTASVAIGGGGSVMFGDWGEEKLTRLALGRAMDIPGLPELLGVSLKTQMALGSVNADDLEGFLFFLPGPTATYLQGLIGTVAGVSFGRGLDMAQLGRPLTYDERVRFLIQSVPVGGLQLARAVNALRLLQTDGDFRRAMDLSEALGMRPPSGELLAMHSAEMSEILGAAIGLPSAERLKELRQLERQRTLTTERQKVMQQAADYWEAGNYDHAMKLIDRYHRNYGAEGAAPVLMPSIQSLKNARERRMTPPGLRMRPPGDLLGHEAFLQ